MVDFREFYKEEELVHGRPKREDLPKEDTSHVKREGKDISSEDAQEKKGDILSPSRPRGFSLTDIVGEKGGERVVKEYRGLKDRGLKDDHKEGEELRSSKLKGYEGRAGKISTAKNINTLKKIFRNTILTFKEKEELFSIEPSIDAMIELVEDYVRNETFYIYHVFFYKPDEYIKDYFIEHSINVSLLSLAIGLEMGHKQKRQLLELGMGGLFHDIGMIGIDERIISKKEALTKGERETIEEHPLKGNKLLKEVKNGLHFLDIIALQEHEREDGSGYPNKLHGGNIHPFAKIVGVCDILESLTHQRFHRDGASTYEMIRVMVSKEKSAFPIPILKSLLRRVTPFPPGVDVMLSTNEIAKVLWINKDNPLRPIVQVIGNKEGRFMRQREIIDLKLNPIIYIVDCYKEDISHVK